MTGFLRPICWLLGHRGYECSEHGNHCYRCGASHVALLAP